MVTVVLPLLLGRRGVLLQVLTRERVELVHDIQVGENKKMCSVCRREGRRRERGGEREREGGREIEGGGEREREIMKKLRERKREQEWFGGQKRRAAS